jgi:glycosyltransferase involved in cell wall biosynthesis
MEREPLVSVIMPAYNAERYIDEAVQSVLQQTWQNWELIIVNDGSTDGTRSYLDAQTDPRIYLYHQENQGVSQARNVGISVARGVFITFLDADDVVPPHSLKSRIKFFQSNPDTDILHGVLSVRNETLQEEKRLYTPFQYKGLLSKALRLDGRLFFNPCYMIKKEKISGVKFQAGMTHCEDILFLINLLSYNLRYSSIQEEVYYYRVSGRSAMTNMQGLMNGYIQLLTSLTKIRTISYLDTLVMRFKITRIFLSWGFKNKNWRILVSVYSLYTIK